LKPKFKIKGKSLWQKFLPRNCLLILKI
jgi:hypothetical protein